jgi:hypothetical protein
MNTPHEILDGCQPNISYTTIQALRLTRTGRIPAILHISARSTAEEASWAFSKVSFPITVSRGAYLRVMASKSSSRTGHIGHVFLSEPLANEISQLGKQISIIRMKTLLYWLP